MSTFIYMKVATLREDEYEKLKISIDPECRKNLILSKGSTYKVSKITWIHVIMCMNGLCLINNLFHLKTWLVSEDLTNDEQSRASKGTTFYPISQFPPQRTREDCNYLYTPAMLAPTSLGNLHACEVHSYKCDILLSLFLLVTHLIKLMAMLELATSKGDECMAYSGDSSRAGRMECSRVW